MKGIYLISYSVNGIKTLDDWAKLSFYKKTFSKDIDIHGYNIKGIYGANGSGKTGIVTSAKILKEIITNSGYLHNPINQKNLGELVNKKTGILEYDIEYLDMTAEKAKLYSYQVRLEKNRLGKFNITRENLRYRIATSHANQESRIYEISGGEPVFLPEEDPLSVFLVEKTQNLLSYASFTSVAIEKIVKPGINDEKSGKLQIELITHFLFASGIFAYLENDDEHSDYFLRKMMEQTDDEETSRELYNVFLERIEKLWGSSNYLLSEKTMIISKTGYGDFEKQIGQLQAFLHIFKRDLMEITVDRREDRDHYYCNLLLHYDSYAVNAEFESTGIKKLIKLFPYLQNAVNGGIVFIDELDSNLHDVYLCALLEYLREYGKGQLCFTSHNIGPMDVLKRNKQAIDFLSSDHHIYSWVKSGNYSPSRLYRNGMIEGSPFNVDAIDFLGVFETEEDN